MCWFVQHPLHLMATKDKGQFSFLAKGGRGGEGEARSRDYTCLQNVGGNLFKTPAQMTPGWNVSWASFPDSRPENFALFWNSPLLYANFIYQLHEREIIIVMPSWEGKPVAASFGSRQKSQEDGPPSRFDRRQKDAQWDVAARGCRVSGHVTSSKSLSLYIGLHPRPIVYLSRYHQ